MWLLIDDVKDLSGFDVIVRTAEAARLLLFANGIRWEGVAFDNDLGTTLEGRHLLEEYLQTCKNAGLRYIPEILLVTNNPVAREAMKTSLLDHGYIPKINNPMHYIRAEL